MPVPAPQPRVVAVIGSPRHNGNTVALVDAAVQELERSGCLCSRIMLSERDIAPCVGHQDCPSRSACVYHDDLPGILDEVYAADGLILASPVYYDNVSSQMKAFMDRNCFAFYHDRWLTTTVVGLVTVAWSSGLEDSIAAMRRFVSLSTKREILFHTLSGYAHEPGEVLADGQLMAEARAFGRAMAESLGLGR